MHHINATCKGNVTCLTLQERFENKVQQFDGRFDGMRDSTLS